MSLFLRPASGVAARAIWWRFVFWTICVHFAFFGVLAAGLLLPEALEDPGELTIFPWRTVGVWTAVAIWITTNLEWFCCALIMSEPVAIYLVWRVIRRSSGFVVACVYGCVVIGLLALHVASVHYLVTLGPILTPSAGYEIPSAMQSDAIVRGLWLSMPSWLILAGVMLVGPPRRQLGLCFTCGYDLRAHAPGQKCPECGREIAGAE